jgi:hypothetical protein
MAKSSDMRQMGQSIVAIWFDLGDVYSGLSAHQMESADWHTANSRAGLTYLMQSSLIGM